ncbi:hypothetical protein CJF42_04200 [Pseudoalteromonas sp. NBT06-2]|uniref:lytic polysaccharide monooxygenase n=1 Tax=Pseudoalteromonas sp. NBT06-2 TaxID=2025950 RepID=UPI000BA762EC|nr:lytic polysaccharide monooxygenase [Pseudoalteromonas sp. NBT06-2]PAJ75528.1 hypothetical protein CJF42_04200 [Pseudoalteromonas sp. NBT06-2]
MFKTHKKNKLSALSLALISALFGSTIEVNAHGYLDSPKARQAICEEQQGYWWPEDGSNIPNAACRAAYLDSGYVQFIQEHEFAVNTRDYNNQAAVEANIPDGTLCAAGDLNKKGMNLPSIHWQRTDVMPNANDDVKVRFRATTPHNPSFWQFYLSNENYDATQALAWSDLTLVQSIGNVDFIKDSDGKRFYEMNVNLPADRAGEAILYTRWQREDVVGEGFYNCSDITIKRDDVQPDTWFDAGFYLKQGQTAKNGETVTFRVFDANGQELVNQQLAVTQENVSNWQTSFAQSLNLDYSNLVSIGVKSPAGDIVFDDQNVLSNSVFLTEQEYSFAVSIKTAPVNTAPIVHDISDINVDELTSVQIHVHAFDDEQTELTFTWSIPSEITYTGSDENIVITAPAVDSNTDYPVSISVSDGMLTTTQSFIVSVNNLAVDPSEPPWSSTKAYSAGDKVLFEGKVYEAKWWNKNEKPNNSNAWKLAAPTDGGVAVWNAQNDYAGGTIVSHNTIQYKAKWWTQGEEPGVNPVWKKL